MRSLPACLAVAKLEEEKTVFRGLNAGAKIENNARIWFF
jgi:hypothetical protein